MSDLFERHPLPWRVVGGDYDLGGTRMQRVLDSSENVVIDLGDADYYYPTNGYAEDGVLEWIVAMANQDVEP